MKWKTLAWCGAVAVVVITSMLWFRPVESGLPDFERATVSFVGLEEREPVTLSFPDRETLEHLFQGVPRDRGPAKWQVFCVVRLFDGTGRQVSQIEVFSNPGGPGPFRIEGNYFLGYDQTAFRELLQADGPGGKSPR